MPTAAHRRYLRRAVLLLLLLAPGARPASADASSAGIAYATGDAALDRLQQLLRPTLDANRKEFQGRLGRVQAFGAGDRYPQVWLRDSATLVPLARYLYSREHLTSWLEEHLACQQQDGALYDWIAAGEAAHFREWAPQAREVVRSGALVLSADKNTTEADQEASAVEAAYQVWRATGDDAWLRKPIAGRPLIERLSAALRFVLTRRFDARLGLVANALTADWGDVGPVYPDQRAIYLDERTPLAAGLYTNALVVRAALRLVEMQAAAGDPVQLAYFRARAAALRTRINAALWQEGAGYYRMHVVTTPERARGFPVDDHIFALGGNAVALLADVASDDQARRILETASARQRRHRVSTVAGVLLPPYPRGVFKHPLMAQEWQYQNGGQWDWFAGRLLLAAFERGHARWAREKITEIARRAVGAGGLYEWATREGEGRGSPRYAGSAASLADAVIHGLFGVELAGGRLGLRVRLGERPGRIRLQQPATGTSVSYEYDADLPARRLRLRYQSSATGRGRVAVLLPPGFEPKLALLDGQPLGLALEAVGEDRFAVVETDWTPHRFELR